jgi:hypothetical protein
VLAYSGFGLLGFVVVVGMIFVLFRYGQTIITKHLSPLTIFIAFFTNAFTIVDFGTSWASPVKSVALGLNTLISLDIDGALFNPKCLASTVNLTAAKIYAFAAIPMVIVMAVFMMYLLLIKRSQGVAKAIVTPPPPSRW